MINKNFKSGFVGIIGRPNVGKSTFLNKVMSQKLAIVTAKAQTTRNKIQGIYTTDNEQIIFVDTPGIHKANHELGKVMNQTAYDSIDGMDVILYFVDARYPISDTDAEVLNSLKKQKVPVILVLNKVDLVQDEEKLKENIDTFKNCFAFAGGITISAEYGYSVDKLLEMIIERLEYGPMYYPEDQILDQPERFVVAEIIREKILLKTNEEVPHSVAVVIESFKESRKNAGLIEINAVIVVERPSQKKIIIGSGGSKIKDIGKAARLDIAKFLGNKVYLELFVKVIPNWRNQKSYLKEFGYKLEK
ncbi:MAG: GTPase Era [Bacilli bacterium]|nr:GTPase Era [Bacilli bacterium]